MALSKDYLAFILGQLADLEEFSYRAMMGEYILYYKGRILGGIYDNRLLLKPVPATLKMLGEPSYELPYPGAKEMIFLEEVADKDFLRQLVLAMYPQLAARKKISS